MGWLDSGKKEDQLEIKQRHCGSLDHHLICLKHSETSV